VIAGAVGGGLAGKSVAESIDPTAEEAHWRQHYASRPYVEKGGSYDDYGPAYRYGWEAWTHHKDRSSFDDVERELGKSWEGARGNSHLTWDRARHAVRDAWERAAGAVTRPQSRPLPPKG